MSGELHKNLSKRGGVAFINQIQNSIQGNNLIIKTAALQILNKLGHNKDPELRVQLQRVAADFIGDSFDWIGIVLGLVDHEWIGKWDVYSEDLRLEKSK